MLFRLCFVSLCLLSVNNGLLALLFSLFYVIREFDGFLYADYEAKFVA